MSEEIMLDGIVLQVGDIIECLNVPSPEHGERYHIIVSRDEIRDLANNNLGMWKFWPPIQNIRHYSKHPEIFSKEDEEHYFPREQQDER